MLFFKFVNYYLFLHIVYDNRIVSARESPWAVHLSRYICEVRFSKQSPFILRGVIDHCGQFQNGRRKIHDPLWNVLLQMVSLNFASQHDCVSNPTFYCTFGYLQILECDI